MSKELRWCKSFLRVNQLMCYHKRKKVRLKNLKRRQRMFEKAIRLWGCFPYPPEWIEQHERKNN